VGASWVWNDNNYDHARCNSTVVNCEFIFSVKKWAQGECPHMRVRPNVASLYKSTISGKD